MYWIDKKEERKQFSKVTISLASPDLILKRSYGEVKKTETINYRTLKPEMDGLFCERIFGPVKDYECACGKYKRVRYKGIICDRCGVEVTEKRVRRFRMGHIRLMVPVVHVWYFRQTPSKLGLLLDYDSKSLEQIVYYERYVVINPGPYEDQLQKGDLITEDEYEELKAKLPKENRLLPDDHPDKFVVKMGAEALEILLASLDLDELSYSLRRQALTERSNTKKQQALKRLKVVEAFRNANKRVENRPEWMIIRIVPVIPPELRPLVPLEGGRFATSDLNELYKRVISRNNRLRQMMEINAPELIMRQEKRMLQEAVDALFDNSRKANAAKASNNRALKSLTDIIKGKQGRFRQNLLGKRVDFSGRSVIVVGPELKLHECGLPKEMAVELFKPFIIRHLTERGIYSTPKSAKKAVEVKDPVIWEILEEVLKGHPVLLNRAPTLHRLGIQAFQPKLIEGKAIQLHPLVCTGFNADFDGDQMAVHVPLSNEACLEAMLLMLSSHNLLHPANGTPITVPSQDMVLGLYYLTKEAPNAKGEGRLFSSSEEVIIAYNQKAVDLHAKIKLRLPSHKLPKGASSNIVETTVGRVIFNQYVPEEIEYVNELLTKKAIKNVIHNVIRRCGNHKTAIFLDAIKELGFYWAFKGGLSFRLSDIIVPPEKEKLIKKSQEKVKILYEQEEMGLITQNERYNQIIDEWFDTSRRIKDKVLEYLRKDQNGFNPIYMMYDSGARGSGEQIRQLGGMRGLMAKPQKTLRGAPGEIIETPIFSNFKEGLTILEYFISTHGARKGLSDTALKTADAGYLTRRLVDVAQDVVITEYDCGTLRGLRVEPIEDEKGEIKVPFSQLIVGRIALEDIYHPETEELICAANQELTEEIVKKIEEAEIRSVEIRSVLTCDAKRGVCVLCYGRNLATGKMAEIGDVVGIMAAQSIGEPGTQLTLRTFHHGGAAQRKSDESDIYAPRDAIVRFDNIRVVDGTNEEGKPVKIVINGGGEIQFLKKDNPDRVLDTRLIPYGTYLYISDGDEVKKGERIGRHLAYERTHYAGVEGIVRLVDLVEGDTYRRERAELTGKEEIVVIPSRDRKKAPTVYIYDLKEEKVLKEYNIPVNARVLVKDGQKVQPNTPLFKTPINRMRSDDITGGLPRVQELFEARRPTNAAILSEIDGVVTIGKLKRSKRLVYVTTRDGKLTREYQIPLEKHILVQDNDFVRAGQPLTDGMIDPMELLRIRGIAEVQQYIINEIQKVYREQGVVIDNKHVEVIVRQMMKKVKIIDPGDSLFLEGEEVEKYKFEEENSFLYDSYYIEDPGDSEKLKAGMLVKENELKEERAELLRKGARLPIARRARTAIAQPLILGITKVSLSTESWISAASFQETPRVLSQAAIEAKTDNLQGLKENVVVGHLIPAGTGFPDFRDIQVGLKDQIAKEVQPDGKSEESGMQDLEVKTTKRV